LQKKLHVYNGMALKENCVYLLSFCIQTTMGKAGTSPNTHEYRYVRELSNW